ncbi:SPOR domain-containing protein [Streptomyces hainanensis]|uniref:SPOR domain-containing protein n=1 Tax=Streptomyces hainanensis TaxID=402648 RepID=A0A4R4T0M0_9ACTN|nr:SPOR domain-containing protein [Streptomyces hainanensis]TDC70197.1 SPOR domain-containing protein [Streptomyces hainanensis]
MNGTNLQPWQVIRQEENGGRYRIGHCATRAEAQRLIQRLRMSAGAGTAEDSAHYVVERVEPATRAHL